jgi:hypothetical protein
MNDDVNPFTTSDTPLAAYLKMRGMVLLHVLPEKDNPTRFNVVFLDEDDRPKLVEEFHQNTGGFKTYIIHFKSINHKINEVKHG